MPLTIPILKFSPHKLLAELDTFLARPAVDPAAEETARRVLDDIRKTGDKAVRKYTKEFNRVDLTPARFLVPRDEQVVASEQVDLNFKRCASEVFARIVRFGKAGMKKDWNIASPKGGVLGEIFTPLERIGAYIPGGAAPLVSTALMSVSLAKIAGVPEIVACTPCDAKGRVNPFLLHALETVPTDQWRLAAQLGMGFQMHRFAMNRHQHFGFHPGIELAQLVAPGVAGDMDEAIIGGDDLDALVDQPVLDVDDFPLIAGNGPG